MLCRNSQTHTRSPDTFFCPKHVSIHYCVPWKRSDISCSSQGIFASLAIQTAASHPGYNRSRCWNHIGASLYYGLAVNDNRAMEFLLLCNWCWFFDIIYPGFCLSDDDINDKRGQASRIVTETQIQTNCDFETSLCSCYRNLVNGNWRHSNVVLELLPHVEDRVHWNICLPHRILFLVCSHFLDIASKSNAHPTVWSPKPTKRGSVTEHSALQKDSTQYTLGTGDFGHLLSSVHCNGSHRGSRRYKSIHLCRLDFSRHPGVS